MNLTPTPKTSPKESKNCQKVPNCGQIKNKKRGLDFHIVNHASQVFFKVSFIGFIDAPVMCICFLVVIIGNNFNNVKPSFKSTATFIRFEMFHTFSLSIFLYVTYSILKSLVILFQYLEGDITLESEEEAILYQCEIERWLEQPLSTRLRPGDLILTRFEFLRREKRQRFRKKR